MLDAAGELQEHLAGVEDYVLAEAVWRHHHTPPHGYEPTREAAMAAFAKSWRRE